MHAHAHGIDGSKQHTADERAPSMLVLTK